jgi:2-methylisocitrate lyase-like PEP mutase family enzyme
MSNSSTTAELRRLLLGSGQIVAPGAYDGLSAKLIEQAGFSAVHGTGAGIAAGLGHPDLGLITMTEMLTQMAHITAATRLPVIADADTGYGNSVNVWRTIREFERIGCAGLHIEDQIMPKKCGQLAGRSMAPIEEMTNKIQCALEARTDPNFVIIARTDARESEGLAGAIKRGKAYKAAGADVVFIMAPHGEEEMAAFSAEVSGPLMVTQSMGGKTPPVPAATLERLRYKIVLYAVAPVMAAAFAMREVLQTIKRDGSEGACHSRMMGFSDLYRTVGINEADAIAAKYPS